MALVLFGGVLPGSKVAAVSSCEKTRQSRGLLVGKIALIGESLIVHICQLALRPGFLDLKQIERVKAAPSKTILISRIDRKSSPSPFSLICHGVSKMLLRGEYAFPGFAVERELLRALPADVRPKALKESDPEIGYEELVAVTPQSVIQVFG